MTWFKVHRRSAIICGVTLLLPMLFYLNVLSGALGLRAEYAAEIDHLEPRIARLQGLMGFEEQLRASSFAAQQQIGKLVYPASADVAAVSAGLQADVRQLMADAGLTVSNSQVLPVLVEEKFDYIGIKLTVEGEVGALDEALGELANFSPMIIVDSLTASPSRQGRKQSAESPQQVTVSIRLLSLRSVL